MDGSSVWEQKARSAAGVATRASILALLLAALGATTAHAGRPLATDDAGTVGEGQCQLETWAERGRNDARGRVFAPACGPSPSTEIGLEYAHGRSPGEETDDAGIAVKWVPQGVEQGPWAFGLKAFAGYGRVRPADWSRSQTGAFGIASRTFGDALTVHLNLGAARTHADRRTSALANAAVAWQPAARLLLFAEFEAMRRVPTTQSAGARWWLLPERLGIDVTASRDVNVADSRRYTVGIGWYGIFGD